MAHVIGFERYSGQPFCRLSVQTPPFAGSMCELVGPLESMHILNCKVSLFGRHLCPEVAESGLELGVGAIAHKPFLAAALKVEFAFLETWQFAKLREGLVAARFQIVDQFLPLVG